MFASHSKDDRLERTEAACAASLAQWRLPVMAPAPAPGRAARPARASVTCHLRPNTHCQVAMRTLSVLIVTGSYQYPSKVSSPFLSKDYQ